MTSVYVASSWRNTFHGLIVHTLRAAKFEVYDFKNPPNGIGFGWGQVDLNTHYDLTTDSQASSVDEYLDALEMPRAIEGYDSDMDAMKAADIFVLVLPCGRSAHLELGWAVGKGKKTAVLLENPCVPELMYKMVDHLSPDIIDLLGWLGVKD